MHTKLALRNAKNDRVVNMEKKLCRSSSNCVIAGVCGGIGAYFGIDPVVVRILLVLFTLFGGAGVLAYVVCWILMPRDIGSGF